MFNFKSVLKSQMLFSKKRFLVFVPIIFITASIAFLPLNFAKAGVIEGLVGGLVSTLTALVLGGFFLAVAFPLFLAFVISVVFTFLAGVVLQWILKMSQSGDIFTHSTFVQTNWALVRDFVGIIFIVILVFIAFSTILRFQKYNIWSLLPKFIAVAILINFSLVISGVILDVSSIVTNFFLSKFIGVNIATSFVSGNIIDTVKDNITTMFSDGLKGRYGVETMMNFVIGMLLYFLGVITFNFIAGMVFISLAVLFVIRIIAIWILLILSPAAWTAWILPQTQKWWKKWWDEFLKWTFIGIPVGFFLYLSFQLLQTAPLLPNLTAESFKSPDGSNALGTVWNAIQASVGNILVIFLQFGTAILLMFMGMMLGLKASGGMAGEAMKIAKKAPGWLARRRLVQEKLTKPLARAALEGAGWGKLRGPLEKIGLGKVAKLRTPGLAAMPGLLDKIGVGRIPGIKQAARAGVGRLEPVLKKIVLDSRKLEDEIKQKDAKAIKRDAATMTNPRDKIKLLAGLALSDKLKDFVMDEKGVKGKDFDENIDKWVKDKNLLKTAFNEFGGEAKYNLASANPKLLNELTLEELKKMFGLEDKDALDKNSAIVKSIEKLVDKIDADHANLLNAGLKSDDATFVRIRQAFVDAIIKTKKTGLLMPDANQKMDETALKKLVGGVQAKGWTGLIKENEKKADFIATNRALTQKFNLSVISGKQYSSLKKSAAPIINEINRINKINDKITDKLNDPATPAGEIPELENQLGLIADQLSNAEEQLSNMEKKLTPEYAKQQKQLKEEEIKSTEGLIQTLNNDLNKIEASLKNLRPSGVIGRTGATANQRKFFESEKKRIEQQRQDVEKKLEQLRKKGANKGIENEEWEEETI